MKTELEQSQNTFLRRTARFVGLFRIKLDCFSAYQAAFALQEYIQGRLEASALEKHHPTLKWHGALSPIFQYYSAHPEIIKAAPNPSVSDILKDYSSTGVIAEKEKLVQKLHSRCKEEKMNLEAYLALALIWIGESETADEQHVGQTKFESAFIWLKSLDPNFTHVRKHLENWANQAIIRQSVARLFLQKISGFSISADPAKAVDEKGKEEADEDISDSTSLSR